MKNDRNAAKAFKVYEYPIYNKFGLWGSERVVLDEETKTVWYLDGSGQIGQTACIMANRLNDDELAQFRKNRREVTIRGWNSYAWDEKGIWENLTGTQIGRKADMFDNPEYWERWSQLWLIRLWLGRTGTSGPDARTVAKLWKRYQKGHLTMLDIVNALLDELGLRVNVGH